MEGNKKEMINQYFLYIVIQFILEVISASLIHFHFIFFNLFTIFWLGFILRTTSKLINKSLELYGESKKYKEYSYKYLNTNRYLMFFSMVISFLAIGCAFVSTVIGIGTIEKVIVKVLYITAIVICLWGSKRRFNKALVSITDYPIAEIVDAVKENEEKNKKLETTVVPSFEGVTVSNTKNIDKKICVLKSKIECGYIYAFDKDNKSNLKENDKIDLVEVVGYRKKAFGRKRWVVQTLKNIPGIDEEQFETTADMLTPVNTTIIRNPALLPTFSIYDIARINDTYRMIEDPRNMPDKDKRDECLKNLKIAMEKINICARIAEDGNSV